MNSQHVPTGTAHKSSPAATPRFLNSRLAKYLVVAAVLPLGCVLLLAAQVRARQAAMPPHVNRVVSEDEARKHPEGRKVVEQTDRGIAAVEDQKRRAKEAQQKDVDRQRREGAERSASLAAQKWMNQKMSNLKDNRGPRYKIGRENGYAALLQDNNGERVPDIIDDILTQIESDDSIKPDNKYNKRRTLFSWYRDNKSKTMDALFEYLSQDKYRAYLPEQIKNLLQKDGKSDQQWRANAAPLEQALKDDNYL